MKSTFQSLKVAFFGFVVALIGAATGFAAFYLEQQFLSIVGFAITVAGVATGFFGVMRGWFVLRKLK
jgi:VIT1/CCC1 family predicted Fe2+/Mn2+ transporter